MFKREKRGDMLVLRAEPGDVVVAFTTPMSAPEQLALLRSLGLDEASEALFVRPPFFSMCVAEQKEDRDV